MENSKQQTIEEFLEWLYDSYKIPLMRIIRRYVDNTNMCEDIFQEVFIRIIKKVDLLHKLSTPKMEAYITLVARGVSIDYIRKYSKDKCIEDNILFTRMSQREQTAKTSYSSLEKVDLSLMLSGISAEDQILLIGKYYIGLSVNDLVEIVGGTPTAIRSKLHRIKKHVFDEWSRSGLNMGDFIDE